MLFLELLLLELEGIEVVVTALLRQQLLVVTLLDDLSVGQQDDIIGMLDGGKAMGHDQHGADVLHLFQGVLDQHFRFGVDVGGGLVQDHDAGLMDDGTGKAQQLPLTGGEVIATLPDRLVQALFQPGDEAVGIDIAAGFPHFLIGNAFLPQQDVAADVAGKQEHILQHLAEVTAQGRDPDLADIDAVDQNLALLDVVIAANEAQNGGLAGAGGADKGHGLLGLHMERNALEDPFIGLIGKPNILKLDLTLDLVELNGVFFVHHLGLHVQNGKDLLRAGEALLQHIKLLSQGLDGVEEPGNVAIEGNHDGAVDDLAHKLRLLDIALGGKVEQAQLAGHKQHIHHGAEDAEDVHSVLLGLFQVAAALGKVLHLPVLPVEDLGDLHAAEVFGKIGVDVGGGVGDLAVDPAAELAEQQGKEDHEGHKAQDHQRQGIIEDEHGRQHAHDDHGVLHQSHQDVGEHEGNAVGVVGDSGHQLAHRDVVELLMAQLLDAGKGVQADLGQDLLTGLLQDHGLEIGADDADDQNAGIQRHHHVQILQFKIFLDQVLDLTHDPGRQHVIHHGEEHDQQAGHKALPMGLGVLQQPGDQFLIGDLPLPVVALVLLLSQGEPGDHKGHGEGADDGGHDHHRQKFFQKLKHGSCLLPLLIFGGLPSCGILHRFRTIRCACQRLPGDRCR